MEPSGSVAGMAARSPRRTFAAPFVVTIVPSLATACFVETRPASPSPQPNPAPVATTPSQPQSSPTERRWIYRKQNGECFASTELNCPSLPPGEPQLTCNPPPPKKIGCPDFLAEGKQVNVVQNVPKSICMVDWGEIKCPAGAICNPPPPRKVDCP